MNLFNSGSALPPGASPSVEPQATPAGESAIPPDEGGEAGPADSDRNATPANVPIKVQNIWMDFEDFCKCFK